MKKFAYLFLSLSFIIMSFSVRIYAQDIAEAPEVRATGAVLMDARTGRVLWERDSHVPMSNASTTKIMTAILALEKGNMTDTVTVSRNAELAPKVKMYLTAGEKINLHDLLYPLMLESSNDAAVAIAEHIGGSVEAFCAMMTERAKELGALDTVFETPNGLDKGDHHSTAYDLAVIARHALNNKEYMGIINTREITIKSDKRTYSFYNKNRLLSEYNGGNGMKTGFTGKAGHCFVGTAKRGDMQLISVVLASGWGDRGKQQKWIDTKNIMNYGFNNYEYVTVVTEGTGAGAVKVDRSKTPDVELLYSQGLEIAVGRYERDGVQLKVNIPESVKAPVTQGDTIGTADIYVGGEIYAEIPLTAAEGATRHDLKTSIEKVVDGWLRLGFSNISGLILPEF